MRNETRTKVDATIFFFNQLVLASNGVYDKLPFISFPLFYPDTDHELHYVNVILAGSFSQSSERFLIADYQVQVVY